MSGAGSVDFTFVIPLYQTGEALRPLIAEFAALQIPESWELVLVDDGSTDSTHDLALSLCHKLAHRTVIAQMARNCGEAMAVLEGLRLAQGRWIVTMDDDLQTPLASALQLLRRLKDCGAEVDVVYASGRTRPRLRVRRLGSWLHQRLLRQVLPDLPFLEVNSFRALSAGVAQELTRRSPQVHHLDRVLLGITRRAVNEPVDYGVGTLCQSRYGLLRLLCIVHELLLLSSARVHRCFAALAVMGAAVALSGDLLPWPARALGLAALVIGATVHGDALICLAHARCLPEQAWVRQLTNLGGDQS